MSASIAARISTRPIRCRVDPRWEASAAVLGVAQYAHVRTLYYAISFALVNINDRPGCVSVCSPKLLTWLVENLLQLLEVNGLDQVKIESGFFGTFHVLLGAETGERDCLDSSVCPRLCSHLVTAAIGQTDVTQHRVDVVRGDDGHRAFHIICSYNVVTKMGKQT